MNGIILGLLLLLFIVYAVLIIYYRFGFTQAPYFVPHISKEAFTTKVSVIIPARNEAKHISACLNAILRNQYPAHLIQIIVVDDHSTDETASLVKSFGNAVKLISLAEMLPNPINSYKKKAIDIAVAHSDGELIICTDADCIAPSLWLQTIVSFYIEKNAAFIAMPVSLISNHSFIENFQQVDFLVLQGITVAAVHRRFHQMCNGANIAYSRKAFLAVNGFEGIDHLASGDDMLLMHKIATAYPRRVQYLKSQEVIVQTAAMPTLSSFLQQRIRWASKAGQYKEPSINLVLLVVYCLNVFILFFPFVGIFYHPTYYSAWGNFSFSLWGVWGFIWLMKILVESYFVIPVARFFKLKNSLIIFMLSQPFHVLYTVVAGWLGKFGQYRWKGRIVK